MPATGAIAVCQMEGWLPRRPKVPCRKNLVGVGPDPPVVCACFLCSSTTAWRVALALSKPFGCFGCAGISA